jgi:peptidoglycan/xylan/chitin deacetylase (PgdA/CDA1 family)
VIGRAATLTAAGVALAHAAPAVTSIAPLRRALWPRLAGIGTADHIALTFDDGPDPGYTPALLSILDALHVRATFFLLGSMLTRAPSLGRDLVAAGHEIALHGWAHRVLLRRGFGGTVDDLARGRDLIEDVTGVAVHWWRPPYGVLTTPGIVAAHRLRLTPILWTAWGRDWTPSASRETVLATVERGLRPGGTVLLHDSDCTSAPGSSRATLAAVPILVDRVRSRGLRIGALAEHGILDPAKNPRT